jgi:23S rRNA (uracil1939-C5)-methyltransferase
MDPPRSGVGRDILLVEKFKPSKVAYISCDPTTLARDISLLKSSGFEIVSVKAFDMFPQTWHVETVVVLSSSKS